MNDISGGLLTGTVIFHLLTASGVNAGTRPYAEGRFQGRIAYSADGNHNDPDDWAASPVALAIFAEAGLTDRLVHFDYNCILPQTNPDWEKTHAESVLGAAKQYGFDPSRFYDCRKNLEAAVASIAKEIDASSADNPLYFILAGPMEVPWMGIQKSDPAKRRFVYCISHSRWNDGFASRYQFTHTKRSVIEQDVRWVQIRDQNRLLSLSRYGRPAEAAEFKGYLWMRDSQKPAVRFLWERMVVSTRPDPSDAGMAWFLATGDEACDPAKLKRLLEDRRVSVPVVARKQVRLEAENFRHLDGCALEDRNDKKASHALNTRLSAGKGATGSIRTPFDEPYTALEARYDLDVCYLDEPGGQTRFQLLINGKPTGEPWSASKDDGNWTVQTIRNLLIKAGDEIAVGIQGDGQESGRLDYVQLNLKE